MKTVFQNPGNVKKVPPLLRAPPRFGAAPTAESVKRVRHFRGRRTVHECHLANVVVIVYCKYAGVMEERECTQGAAHINGEDMMIFSARNEKH